MKSEKGFNFQKYIGMKIILRMEFRKLRKEDRIKHYYFVTSTLVSELLEGSESVSRLLRF